MKRKKKSKAKKPKRAIKSTKSPKAAPIKSRYPSALEELFTYGEPDVDSDAAQIWASEMGDHVDDLAKIVLDAECNSSEVPTCWATLHALNVLTALKAPGPAGKLLELFGDYDEWLNPAAGEYFAALGEEGLSHLKAYLTDRSRDPGERLYAADALTTLVQEHPALRAEVVSFLCDVLERPEADDNEAEEKLTTAVINCLCYIGDEAALPAIKKAFQEDRVDTLQFTYDYAEDKLKGRDRKPPELPIVDDGITLPIRCLACGRERHYDLEKVFYDRTYATPDSRYSPLFVAGGFTCSKCGAEEQYDISSLGSLSVLTRMMGAGQSGDEVDPRHAEKGIIPISFAAFGEPMHPFAAMERYKALLKRDPKDDANHIGYASTLAFLGYSKEALVHYEKALALNPDNFNAMVKMGQAAQKEGKEEAAINWYAKAREVVERVDLPLEDREVICDALEAEIQWLEEGVEPSEALQQLLLDASGRVQRPEEIMSFGGSDAPASVPFARTEAKVKPNDRCPCGSGKKYKKCCM